MRSRHIILGLLTVTIWGLNFVFIQIALQTVPPLLLSGLRMLLTAVPIVFFVQRPRVPFGTLALYGIAIFALQFGLLFTGMRLGVPAGLASLIHQVQVFFTIAIAMRVFGDRPSGWSWLGAGVAATGILVIALHSRGEISPIGLVVVICASMSWAVGNIAAKSAGAVNPFALVVWGTLIAAPPLLLASLVLEGPSAIGAALTHMSLGTAGSLAYIAYISTLVGFSLWAELVRSYPSAYVAPFTLLVPVVGFVGAAIIVGEPLPVWKLEAAGLVLIGLGLNLFGARLVGAVSRRWAAVRA